MTPFKETTGLIDEKVLTQFSRDSKDFNSMKQPVSLIKFENEETIDPHTGYILYKINIWYEGSYDHFHYEYVKN